MKGRGGAEGDGEGIKRQSLRDFGHGERASFQPAGVSVVSPHEDDRQVGEEKESDKMEIYLRRVFGESSEKAVERERQGDV